MYGDSSSDLNYHPIISRSQKLTYCLLIVDLYNWIPMYHQPQTKYSPRTAPVDIFLFQHKKRQLMYFFFCIKIKKMWICILKWDEKVDLYIKIGSHVTKVSFSFIQ